MANPTSRATRLVVHTAGSRIMRMSISGEAERFSTHTHTAARTTAATSSPSTAAEVQPHRDPWLSASSRQTSHDDSRIAGRTLILPGVRTGDSGTKTTAASAAAAVMIIGNQNSQW